MPLDCIDYDIARLFAGLAIHAEPIILTVANPTAEIVKYDLTFHREIWIRESLDSKHFTRAIG